MSPSSKTCKFNICIKFAKNWFLKEQYKLNFANTNKKLKNENKIIHLQWTISMVMTIDLRLMITCMKCFQ